MSGIAKTDTPKTGFRNANSDEFLAISEKLLSASREKYMSPSKENILEAKNKAITRKKKLKYKEKSRSNLCSKFPVYNENKVLKNKFISELARSKPYPNQPRLEKISYRGEKFHRKDLAKTIKTDQKTPKRKNSDHGKNTTTKINYSDNINSAKKPMALSTPFKRPRRIEHKKDGKMAEIGQKLKNLVLSDQQKNVLKQVVEGKNVFFTGCAGTGKSVLIKEIHAVLKQRKLKVHVTASTGLAAFNLNGRTLHSWAGIGFGKGQPEKLVKNIRKKREVYSRWMSTKILIIDEISMISGVIFDKLDFIARKMRSNEKPFGGIQLVLCGDFLQLPPVNVGKLTFEANAWQKCISDENIFELTKVFRQTDTSFIDMLSELRKGVMTPKTKAVLSQTSTNVLPKDSVMIHCHRNTVAKKNALMLKALKTKAHFYEAKDSSTIRLPSDYLKNLFANCPAPLRLVLKIGAPVILVKNISDELVNGLSGKVTDFFYEKKEDEYLPVVQFKTINEPIIIERNTWSIEKGDGSVLACRKQLPLNLSWALTIHKCQGMTLENAVMDLGLVWEPGHFYVAVSRLKSLNGLKIIGNFSESCVKANPKVLTWMENKGILKRQSVAKQPSLLEIGQLSNCNDENNENKENVNSKMDKLITNLHSNSNFKLESKFGKKDLAETESPLSFFQSRMNKIKNQRRKVHSDPSGLAKFKDYKMDKNIKMAKNFETAKNIKMTKNFETAKNIKMTKNFETDKKLKEKKRFSMDVNDLNALDSILDEFAK